MKTQHALSIVLCLLTLGFVLDAARSCRINDLRDDVRSIEATLTAEAQRP